MGPLLLAILIISISVSATAELEAVKSLPCNIISSGKYERKIKSGVQTPSSSVTYDHGGGYRILFSSDSLIGDSQTDDYSQTYIDEKIASVLLFFGGICLVLIGLFIQCCGFHFVGMTLIAIGIVFWIIAVIVGPTASDYFVVFPIVLLLCVAPCWYATYEGKTPFEIYIAAQPVPSSRAGRRDPYERTPLIRPRSEESPPKEDIEAGVPLESEIRGATEHLNAVREPVEVGSASLAV